MPFQHIDLLGRSPRLRRPVSQIRSVTAEDAKSPDKLSDALCITNKSIEALQATAPMPAVEYEVDLIPGSPVRLEHGFGCPTRFFMTHWKVSDDTGQADSETAAEDNPLAQTNAEIEAAAIVVATDLENAGQPGSLNGLSVWLYNLGQMPGVPQACRCQTIVSASAVFKAPRGSYDIVFDINGVMEGAAYTGGTADGYYYIGGSPPGSAANRYKIIVSNPAAYFFVNNGAAVLGTNYTVSMQKTIRVAAGATVTVISDSVDSYMNKETQGFSMDIVSMTKV